MFAGNPEEGELRPQLLDRFGMHAQIGTVRDPEMRVQIVSERSTFDENPADFHKRYAEKQVGLICIDETAASMQGLPLLDSKHGQPVSCNCGSASVDLARFRLCRCSLH